MLLAHDDVELALPAPIPVAELAVLVTLRVACLVFLPEQKQGDSLALELPVNIRPYGEGTVFDGHSRGNWEELPFQGKLIESLG
jgi:hypothetical protein